jgi:hypothetical protein
MNTTARMTKIKGKVSLPPFIQKSQGVYGMGTAALLYKLDGVEKKFQRNIGWIYSDGGYKTHEKGEAFLGAGLFTLDQLKVGAIKFIDSLLD